MVNKKRLQMVGLTLLMMLVLGLAVAGCGGSGGGSGDEVALLYTYAAGDSWTQEMTMTASGTMEGLEETEAGAEATATEEITKMRVTTTVDELNDDGGANLTVTYEMLESTVNGEVQDIAGQEPEVVTMTVDKTGKVVATESADGTGVGSEFLESGQMFGSSDFGSQFSNMMYPEDGTAKVGEEWTSTSTMPLTGMDQELTITTKSKLTAVATENGRELATIEYSTTIPMDLTLDLGAMLQAMMEGFGTEGTEGEDMAFKMTMKGDIVFTGVAKVETATGQAVSSDGDGTVDFEMLITEAPELFVPSDQRGPFTSNMTMTVSVVEVQ
jgi:hypothetical protein